ncbi:MAG: hypothetical protein ACRC8T_04800 [Acidaminococcaceae bacterium]
MTSSPTVQALTLMAIALPTMFAVIAVFIGATVALKNAFPGSEDDN